MPLIHPTAVVDPGARVDPTAAVGAFCILGDESVIAAGAVLGARVTIEGPVTVGEGARLGDGAIVRGPAAIGARAALYPYVVVGQVGQYAGCHREDGRVEIGAEATLREFVVVNKPVTSEATVVGEGCYLMARTQVDHDCWIEPFVKTATGVTLGGSVHVESHAYLGMNAVVHQGLRIGRAAMVGMNGAVTAHVPPFTVIVERRVVRVNRVGLERLGVTEVEIALIERLYRALAEGREDEAPANPWGAAIASFLQNVAPGRIARLALYD